MFKLKAASAATDAHNHKVAVDAPLIDDIIVLLDASVEDQVNGARSFGRIKIVRDTLKDIKARDQADIAGFVPRNAPTFDGRVFDDQAEAEHLLHLNEAKNRDLTKALLLLRHALRSLVEATGMHTVDDLCADLGVKPPLLHAKWSWIYTVEKLTTPLEVNWSLLKAMALRIKARKALKCGDRLKGLLLHLEAHAIDGRLELEIVDPLRGTDPEGDALSRIHQRDAALGRGKRLS